VNKKKKILIVEDDIPLAMMLVAMFTEAGCDAKAATTGKKAMDLAAWKKFDLIALDVYLPDMSGFEICDDLKQRHISKNTPIVFITGKPSEADRKHGLKIGAADYIAKPFGKSIMQQLLRHVRPEEIAISV
jgi:DNA-binding response OmpR family regulator